LAVMYTNGEGVRQNKSKALELFGKACDLSNESGCKNYAILKNQGVR
jgi:TPR repeat protein